MKKIVFFSGGIDRSGGTERVLSIIASGLAARDYEVIIVSMCGEKKSHYPLDERITFPPASIIQIVVVFLSV